MKIYFADDCLDCVILAIKICVTNICEFFLLLLNYRTILIDHSYSQRLKNLITLRVFNSGNIGLSTKKSVRKCISFKGEQPYWKYSFYIPLNLTCSSFTLICNSELKNILLKPEAPILFKNLNNDIRSL